MNERKDINSREKYNYLSVAAIFSWTLPADLSQQWRRTEFVGFQQLGRRMSDVGCYQVGCRMSDFNKSEVGFLQVECRMSDFLSRMSDGTYKLP